MKPILYHIVAMADDRVIGKENRLPWHFSADMKHFKELTLGSTVIMGRKTFESIGRPLPGRENFVLSRTQNKIQEHLKFFDSLGSALEHIETPKAFFIGGAELYAQTIGIVDGVYLTRIYAGYDGDAFYPQLPLSFKEVSRKVLQESPKLEAIYYAHTEKK